MAGIAIARGRYVLMGDTLDLRTTGVEFAGRDRPPHLRTYRDGWRHLRVMLLYSPRWLFLIPGCALLLLGGIPGVTVTILGVQIVFASFFLSIIGLARRPRCKEPSEP